MTVTKIVITGGPCAGKTEALAHVKQHFTALGYTVLCVAETATELISGGIAPWTCGSHPIYQNFLLQLQLEKERIFDDAAATLNAEHVLIFFDRGALDGKAYMTDADFTAMVTALGTTEDALISRYDAVFHLTSAAKGGCYTLENNAARTETAAEAARVDDRTLQVWEKHPHRTVIPCTADPAQKMERLTAAIEAFLKKENNNEALS